MNAREGIAWALAGIAISGFIVMDVFIMTTSVDRLIDMGGRLQALECASRIERAGADDAPAPANGP